MAEAPNTYTAFFSPSFTAPERRRIGNEIIDFIVTRTKQGKGVGGSKFLGNDGDGKYSDSYVGSGEFEAAGKTKSNINLTLTGDMLDLLLIVDFSIAGRVVIGFRDRDANDKSVWMREKGYNFLGLSGSELNNILANFRPQDIVGQVAQELEESISETFLKALLGGN